jgi:hypothetical protein
MKTDNLIIYHGQHCGAIEHREPEDVSPHCCGKEMAKAAAETIVSATGETPPRSGWRRDETTLALPEPAQPLRSI